MQVCRLVGGLNAVQQLGLVVRPHAAFVNTGLGEFGGVRLACIGLVLAHIFQHRRDAFAGLPKSTRDDLIAFLESL